VTFRLVYFLRYTNTLTYLLTYLHAASETKWRQSTNCSNYDILWEL